MKKCHLFWVAVLCGWMSFSCKQSVGGDEVREDETPTIDEIWCSVSFVTDGCDEAADGQSSAVPGASKYSVDAIADIQVIKGETATRPKDPVATGMDFVGWFEKKDGVLAETPFDFKTPIEKDVKLFAKWKPKSYVVALMDGDVKFGDATATFGEVLSDLAELPEKAGLHFVGFYLGDVQYLNAEGKGSRVWDVDSDAAVMNARWSDKAVFKFVFKACDGTDNEVQESLIEGESLNLPECPFSREGWDFALWIREKDGAEFAVGTPYATTSDETFLAKWTAIEYSIEYELNGDENPLDAPTKYTVEFPEITLPTPHKDYNEFLRWIDGNGNAASTIPAGSTGDKIFTAKWCRLYTFEEAIDMLENEETIDDAQDIKIAETPSSPNDALKNLKDALQKHKGAVSLDLSEIAIAEIGSDKFRDCTSLASIVLPESVTSIGNGAFQSCTSLENVVLPENVEKIGDRVFFNCSVKIINIPAGLKIIESQAFKGANIPSEVVLKNVEKIGDHAFHGCTGLEKIVIFFASDGDVAGNVIGGYAFSECADLENVSMSGNVGKILDSTFKSCKKLESVEIPAVTEIEKYAFADCEMLENLKFEGSVEQWSQVVKGENWKKSCNRLSVVHCSDGDAETD